MVPGLLWGIVCPSSLPASGNLQYRVSLLSGDECPFEQVITLLKQHQQLLSPVAANPSTLTVWSGERLKLAGLGVAWQAHFTGENSFAAAEDAWRDLCEHTQDISGDEHENSGAAARLRQAAAEKNYCSEPEQINWPLVLGSFGFTSSTPSLLLVPALAVVSSGGNTWLWQAHFKAGQIDSRGRRGDSGEQAQSAAASIPEKSPISPSHPAQVVSETYPHLKPEAWKTAVGCAAAEIRSGRAEKIVLARDKELRFDRDVSLTRVTKYLADKYPNCWTYALGDLVGASPEMLASVNEGKLLCRVLAGSAAPGKEQRLLSDPKEQLEHRLAVQSAQDSLTDLNLDLEVPAPHLLHLGYVTHLATDITAENLTEQAVTSLRAAAALHPTAAVCGKPREVAAERLSALEAMDRRRYAAPIGWMDASGEGEWAIALRCAQRDPARADTYRLIAGAGIMADSDPQQELAETETKMLPLYRALQA
ncbi:isochorismate synthase [Varibaculum cambriense]|uniref:isochorismate synthase n=1 Tax=Varibaculum cambriense TaxID=184870 RepID=UPI00241E2CAF|nr:isochorismate synthase [Varibaculum cambriense]